MRSSYGASAAYVPVKNDIAKSHGIHPNIFVIFVIELPGTLQKLHEGLNGTARCDGRIPPRRLIAAIRTDLSAPALSTAR